MAYIQVASYFKLNQIFVEYYPSIKGLKCRRAFNMVEWSTREQEATL